MGFVWGGGGSEPKLPKHNPEGQKILTRAERGAFGNVKIRYLSSIIMLFKLKVRVRKMLNSFILKQRTEIH